MNRVALLVSVSTVCFFGAQIARAETVAIVDTQKVISESIIGKAAKNNLEGQIKKGQAKLTALKSDFDKQKAELEKQSSILSGSALESRREALQKKQEDFQRAYQEIQEKLAKSNEAELKKVVDQINEVVEDLADERGYKFVFERDRQSVLYASDRLDITNEVVKILDKKKVSL
jgi:outer membrane protein